MAHAAQGSHLRHAFLGAFGVPNLVSPVQDRTTREAMYQKSQNEKLRININNQSK
jgi:hypothetical protein